MADTNVPVWVAAFGTLGGVVVGLLAPFVTASMTVKREREARRETREEATKDRLREFQKQTLIDLQDALNVLLKSEMQLHVHDNESFDETGDRQPYPEALDVAGMEAYAVVVKFGSRVRDATLRDALSQVTVQLQVASETPVALVASREAMQRGVEMGVRLVELIGERIRTLDDEEAA